MWITFLAKNDFAAFFGAFVRRTFACSVVVCFKASCGRLQWVRCVYAMF